MIDKLQIHLDSPQCHVMDIHPGSLLTKDVVLPVYCDENGNFRHKAANGIARISVIERHHNTGNVANALIRGYGIKTGAAAVSVGHDSHNILTLGTNTADMYLDASRVIELGGGIILADQGEILEELELPVAGLMSVLSAEEAAVRFEKIRNCAIAKLGVNSEIDPIMTLCFMSLTVIPEIKLTDMGLFHVGKQQFIKLEA